MAGWASQEQDIGQGLTKCLHCQWGSLRCPGSVAHDPPASAQCGAQSQELTHQLIKIKVSGMSVTLEPIFRINNVYLQRLRVCSLRNGAGTNTGTFVSNMPSLGDCA